MGAKKREPVVIKKVKPYPILAKIYTSETLPPLEGQILRLTTLGFQLELTQVLFSVGDIYKVEFTLPLFEKTIIEQVKIVKTMDRFKDERATIKSYLVEMHFIHLKSEYSKRILEFEQAINQPPGRFNKK